MKYVVSVRYEEALETYNYEQFNVPAALTKHGHSFNASKSALLRKLHKDASSSASEKLHFHTKDHLWLTSVLLYNDDYYSVHI